MMNGIYGYKIDLGKRSINPKSDKINYTLFFHVYTNNV